MAASIAAETPGDYYVGRRYYKEDYKFWGFIRSPRQPWSTAKLVMLNEQEVLAPDRAQGKLGSDNNASIDYWAVSPAKPFTNPRATDSIPSLP
jgi:hypothetical protein